MQRHSTRPNVLLASCALGALAVLGAGPAAAQSTKDMLLQVQRDLAVLQETQRQRDLKDVERFTAIETLIKQNAEATARLNQAIAVIERSVNKQSDALLPPVTRAAAKADALSDQFGGLRDAVEETNSMLAKLLTQVADVKTQLTTLPPPGMAPAGGEQTDGGEGFGESFFTNAYNDLNRGSYDLAKAQFEDFLRYSASSPRAAEAQYYLGQIAYTQGDFGAALSAFDLVLERYPVGFITPEAQYKKALSLMRLGRAGDARRELETLVARFPNSSVSENARGMLQEMGGNAGAGDSAAKPSPFRP